MQFFLTTANLSYDKKCSPFSDHTNVSHDLQLLSLAQRLRHVHHLQATPISYTFLVVDCWSNTATLSYKPFDSLVKCVLSYCLVTLQHIPCVHYFYCNGTSLEDQPSPKGVCGVLSS